MIETEYFQGRSVDDPKKSWSETVIEILCFACLGALLAVAIPGCSTEPPKSGPRMEVCEMQVLGQSDAGLPVVAMACTTPEDFKERQK